MYSGGVTARRGAGAWAVDSLIPDTAAIFAGVVCSRRYTSATIARRDGRSLQRRSPSRVTMSMVTHSTSACGRSGAAGLMTDDAPEQRG
jgi:hypothetical protein